MFCAVKQKVRVRRDVERRTLQPIVFQIHTRFLAKITCAAKKSFPVNALT
jgi:hypothetical protein